MIYLWFPEFRLWQAETYIYRHIPTHTCTHKGQLLGLAWVTKAEVLIPKGHNFAPLIEEVSLFLEWWGRLGVCLQFENFSQQKVWLQEVFLLIFTLMELSCGAATEKVNNPGHSLPNGTRITWIKDNIW